MIIMCANNVHLISFVSILIELVLCTTMGADINSGQLPDLPLLLNDSSCLMEWCSDMEPPPDMSLMPPPPLPPFLQTALAENESFRDNANCNFCNLFHDSLNFDAEIMLPKPAVKTSDSWMSVLVASVLGSTIFGALFLVFIIKCKKWKIFPVSDSCPILPESFLGGHKSAPPPCSPTDSCISPVVNEKSPQSVITDAPTKKTAVSSKYWKRGQNCVINSPEDNHGDVSTDMDPYSDVASCTSSPVYAELDAAGAVTHALSTPNSIILSGPSISPYAVCNTYSEVADAVRMAALGSSSALLPDASYDNAAYLPTSNVDHYNNSRSLRRAHRTATLGQLGSTTPLLSSHYTINGSPQINYSTGGRPLKKPRPLHAQHLSRARMQPQSDELQSTRFDRHGAISRRHHGIYNDLPVHSPTLSTFRAPQHFRDNPKRPLPPVPGVML